MKKIDTKVGDLTSERIIQMGRTKRSLNRRRKVIGSSGFRIHDALNKEDRHLNYGKFGVEDPLTMDLINESESLNILRKLRSLRYER